MKEKDKLQELENRLERLERPSREDKLDKLLSELDRKGFNATTRRITLEITNRGSAYLTDEENQELFNLLGNVLKETNFELYIWDPHYYYTVVILYQEEEQDKQDEMQNK